MNGDTQVNGVTEAAYIENPSQMQFSYSERELIDNLDAQKVMEVLDFAK